MHRLIQASLLTSFIHAALKLHEVRWPDCRLMALNDLRARLATMEDYSAESKVIAPGAQAAGV